MIFGTPTWSSEIHALSACLLACAARCIAGQHVPAVVAGAVLRNLQCTWDIIILHQLTLLFYLLNPPHLIAWSTRQVIKTIFVCLLPSYNSRVWWRHGRWRPCIDFPIGYSDTPFFAHFSERYAPPLSSIWEGLIFGGKYSLCTFLVEVLIYVKDNNYSSPIKIWIIFEIFYDIIIWVYIYIHCFKPWIQIKNIFYFIHFLIWCKGRSSSNSDKRWIPISGHENELAPWR